MIRVEGLTKAYRKKRVLTDICLHIGKGEILGLIGPNGAGKSTLLSILATIKKPTAGTISICGRSMDKHKKEIRQLIGYVPQDVTLLNDLSVKENLIFWSKFSKEAISETYLIQLCKTVNLSEQWDKKVANLSGGMKRKLNILIALIHNPPILLMDEPTVGIDIQSKMEINQYLRQLALEGKTIVYITHDMNEILHTCDRIAVMKSGKIEFIGSIAAAKQRIEDQNVTIHCDEDVIHHLFI